MSKFDYFRWQVELLFKGTGIWTRALGFGDGGMNRRGIELDQFAVAGYTETGEKHRAEFDDREMEIDLKASKNNTTWWLLLMGIQWPL